MVCVGAGGAGVTAAVTAAASGLRVLIVSKDPIGYGNTRIALGGLASAGIVDEDSPGNLYDDMLAGGEHINNPSLARAVALDSRLAPGIAEAQGIVFRRDSAGLISRPVVARPGGHNFHRSVRAIGKGVAMGHGLRAAIARSGADVLEDAITLTLLRDGESVVGLVAWDVAAGRPVVVRSKAVVLASGGLGWLYYPHTDCTKSSTGDGYAMALAAGANLVDMEQVQFVPFACTRPASMVGLLLGEPSWAGPGGRLLDARGREVGTGIHRLTRAQVSKMIGVAVEEGRGTPQGGLLLDLHPNLSLPQGQALWDRLKADGYLDVAKRAYGPNAYTWEDPWEVAPSAHFQMGGVRIDEHGQTAVPGLLAAGEVAGGVHGANRLGGVALTEIFAFGRRAGMAATRRATSVGQSPLPADLVEDALSGATGLLGASGEHRPITLVCRLQRAMWRGAGVVRSEAGISAALDEVRLLRRQSASLSVGSEPRYNFELVDAIELRHMLSTAETVLASAMLRRESRGAHVRSDYPDRDDAKWRANIVARAEGSRIDLVVEPAAAGAGGG